MVKVKMWQNINKIEITKGRKLHKNPFSVNKLSEEKRHSLEEKGTTISLKEIMKQIEALIGLKSVKKLIQEMSAFIEIQKLRQKEKLALEPMALHMIFKGNPGTGKTTVARLLGQLFKEMGVLEKGHIIEVERADLVGEYIGHTAKRTREIVKKSLGGVMFIDEAYSLARGGEKDFGKEAIDTLVKAMEDYKNNLILILAGYKKEMEFFIETNPGLRSRFPIHIYFPDYTVQELMDIAETMLVQRQYKLTRDAEEQLRIVLKTKSSQYVNSGNGRLVRNIIERAMRLQALRLVNLQGVKLTRNDLLMINGEDISNAFDDLTEK